MWVFDLLMILSLLAIPFCIFYPRIAVWFWNSDISTWWLKLTADVIPSRPNRAARRRK